MTNQPMPIPSPVRQDKSACPHRVALFAALYQALELCPPGKRGPILNLLETRLGSAYDDLNEKFNLLLDAGQMSATDKIHGLWLLYLSFIVYPQPQPGVQLWIGADLFSDDQHECLRLRGPATVLPDPHALEREMSILAWAAAHEKAEAEVSRVAPDQLSITVRMHGTAKQP